MSDAAAAPLRFKYGRWGLKDNPVGAQVRLVYRGRALLGDVKECFRDEDGTIRLRIRHFNGEPWPIEPPAAVVEVLDRTA